MLTLALFYKIQKYFREVGNQMRLSTEIKCALFRTVWNSPGQNPTLYSSQQHGPIPTSAIPFTLEQFNSMYSVGDTDPSFLPWPSFAIEKNFSVSHTLASLFLSISSSFRGSSNENEGHNLNHILSLRQFNKWKVFKSGFDFTFVPYKSGVFNLHLFSLAIGFILYHMG